MGIEEPGKPGVLQRKQGSLYRLDERGGKKMADGIDISNGLTWNKDLKYVPTNLQDSIHIKIMFSEMLLEKSEIFQYIGQ